MKIETIHNTDSDLHGRAKETRGDLRQGTQQGEPCCVFSNPLSTSVAAIMACKNVTKGGFAL